MAIDDEERKKELEGDTGGASQSGGTTNPSMESGVAGSGQAVSSSGSPVGGKPSSAWTNIQDYLTANQGNTASSGFLKNNVTDKLQNEQQDLTNQASGAVNDSKTYSDRTNIGQDQASKLIQDASSAGKGTDTYNQNTGAIKSGLQSYSGPQDFTASLSADAQNYGSGLSNNFQQLMTNLYGKQAGHDLTPGQAALQSQLDVNPTTGGTQLEAERQNALSQYAGLNANFSPGGLVDTTNQQVSNYYNQGTQNQGNLNNYLNGYGQQQRQSLTDAENLFNTQENTIQQAGAPANYPTGQQAAVFTDPGISYGGQVGMGQITAQAKPQVMQLDATPFTSFQSGGTANDSNIAGMDAQRNQWNTLQDILNQPQNQIQADVPISHGAYKFDDTGYGNAVQKIIDQEKAIGFNPISGFTTPDQAALIASGAIAPTGKPLQAPLIKDTVSARPGVSQVGGDRNPIPIQDSTNNNAAFLKLGNLLRSTSGSGGLRG